MSVKKGDKLIADMLEGGRLDGVFEAVQSRVTEARHKAAQIENEAKQAAKNVEMKAHSEAAAVRAQAERDAIDIKTEAKLALREVRRARTEVEDLQSSLNYQRKLFTEKTEKFKLAIAGVFERHQD